MRPFPANSQTDVISYSLQQFSGTFHLIGDYVIQISVGDSGVKVIIIYSIREWYSYIKGNDELVAHNVFLLEYPMTGMEVEVGKSDLNSLHQISSCDSKEILDFTGIFSTRRACRPPFKLSSEISVYNLLCQLRRDESCGQYKEIGIVMLSGKACKLREPA